jgi:hypothetical protein
MSFFPKSYCLGVAILCLIGVQFSAPNASYADTYSLVNLHSDQNYFFTGMDDSGLVVLNTPSGGAPCGFSTCYLSFLNGVAAGTSTTAPTFTADNGTPCAPAVPSGATLYHGVCNNGRSAFEGVLSAGQIFSAAYVDASSPTFLSLSLSSLAYGPIYMNSRGDIVFDNIFTENWVEAINQSALATPEPTSLLLLSTGLMGGCAFIYRRRATA